VTRKPVEKRGGHDGSFHPLAMRHEYRPCWGGRILVGLIRRKTRRGGVVPCVWLKEGAIEMRGPRREAERAKTRDSPSVFRNGPLACLRSKTLPEKIRISMACTFRSVSSSVAPATKARPTYVRLATVSRRAYPTPLPPHDGPP
jgi:hypothetical protein